MTKKLLALVLCILALAPAPPSDTKVYSPGMCHPVPVSWTFTPNVDVPFRWFGSTYAAELGPQGPVLAVTTHCPIVRDVVSNTNGLSNITVYVFDNSTTGQVSCSVVSASADGVQTFSTTTLATGIAAKSTNGSTALNFGSNMNHSFNGGHYDVLCSVTGAGSISGITYVEKNGGNSL
jgi:hypothetical protein